LLIAKIFVKLRVKQPVLIAKIFVKLRVKQPVTVPVSMTFPVPVSQATSTSQIQHLLRGSIQMDVIVLDWEAEARRVRTEAYESRSMYRSGTRGRGGGEATAWRDQQG
jgi:hypothetical protein